MFLGREIVMEEVAVKSVDGEITIFAASEVYSIAIYDDVVIVAKKDGTTARFWRKIHGYYYDWQTQA